jgi:hypothetical protein
MKAFKCDVCKRLFEGNPRLLQDLNFTVVTSGYKLTVEASLTPVKNEGLPDVCESCAIGIRELIEESMKEALVTFSSELRPSIKRRRRLKSQLAEGEFVPKKEKKQYVTYGKRNFIHYCLFCRNTISENSPCKHLTHVRILPDDHPTKLKRGEEVAYHLYRFPKEDQKETFAFDPKS